MITRRATLDDLPWIMAELPALDRFYGTMLAVLGDTEYVESRLAWLIDEHMVLIAVNDVGESVGFAAAMVGPHFFNPILSTLTLTLWWVQQEHRGSRAGGVLLDALESYAARHCHWMIVGMGVNCPVRAGSLTGRGFKLQESTYMKENPAPPEPWAARELASAGVD